MPRKTRSKRFRKKRSRKNVLKHVGGGDYTKSWERLFNIIEDIGKDKINRSANGQSEIKYYISFKGKSKVYPNVYKENFEFIAEYTGIYTTEGNRKGWYTFKITKIVQGYYVINYLLYDFRNGYSYFVIGTPNEWFSSNRRKFFSSLDGRSITRIIPDSTESNVVSPFYNTSDGKTLKINDVFAESGGTTTVYHEHYPGSIQERF